MSEDLQVDSYTKSNDTVEHSVASLCEALLFVADQPLSSLQIATIAERTVSEVETALVELQSRHATSGFVLREVAGGWKFLTNPVFASQIEAFVRDGQVAKLTQAALETLAVIAYKQPVSRARISAIRGVNVDSVVKTLELRGLIAVVGEDEITHGLLYGTTDLFLERTGLVDISQLPSISEHVPSLSEAIEIEGNL